MFLMLLMSVGAMTQPQGGDCRIDGMIRSGNQRPTACRAKIRDYFWSYRNYFLALLVMGDCFRQALCCKPTGQ